MSRIIEVSNVAMSGETVGYGFAVMNYISLQWAVSGKPTLRRSRLILGFLVAMSLMEVAVSCETLAGTAFVEFEGKISGVTWYRVV
jgi:hypothetical protein